MSAEPLGSMCRAQTPEKPIYGNAALSLSLYIEMSVGVVMNRDVGVSLDPYMEVLE